MAASNTRFTQNSLGQSKTPIDSDHGIYRYNGASSSWLSAARRRGHSRRGRSSWKMRSRWAKVVTSGGTSRPPFPGIAIPNTLLALADEVIE